MPAKDRLTKSQNIGTTPREIDFVERFARNWEHLREIFGVTRFIQKPAGAKLTSKYASVTLQPGNVGEGEEIPYSQSSVQKKEYGNITVEKYAKAVSIEAINEHGYNDAVGMTDDEFLYELQNEVVGRFYAFANTGTLTSGKTTFQAALAEAQGRVRNKFKAMKRGITDIVGFCNILDAYDYLGAANITVQTAFGLNYIENFIGYRRLFLCTDSEVARGKVIATPVQNLINYYISASDPDFARADLVYTTDNITGIIGVHMQGDYKTAVTETFALLGMTMMAEYIDGIAVVTFNGSMGTVAATSAAGTTSGTKLTITTPTTIPADWTFYFKSQANTAPSAPDYLAAVPDGFTKLTVVNGVADNVTATNAHKGTLLAVNAAGQVVAASAAITVTA